MFYKSILALTTIALSGCAAQQKPALPEQAYDKFAQQIVVLDRCGLQGKMQPDLAAFAKAKTTIDLATWSYEEDKMMAAIKVVEGYNYQIPMEVCNSYAVGFEGVRLKDKAAAARPVPSYMPRTTNCSTYFGQTHCTTY
jgi:hypothetical protein